MNEYFKLLNTYDVVLKFSTNTRPVRIEIFRSLDNEKKYKARVWDQSTYNLYPTFANISEEAGLENKLFSCDEVNREITTLLSDDPNDLFWGKEWESEDQYFAYLKELILKYQEILDK